jgi:hypothetical protein
MPASYTSKGKLKPKKGKVKKGARAGAMAPIGASRPSGFSGGRTGTTGGSAKGTIKRKKVKKG